MTTTTYYTDTDELPDDKDELRAFIEERAARLEQRVHPSEAQRQRDEEHLAAVAAYEAEQARDRTLIHQAEARIAAQERQAEDERTAAIVAAAEASPEAVSLAERAAAAYAAAPPLGELPAPDEAGERQSRMVLGVAIPREAWVVQPDDRVAEATFLGVRWRCVVEFGDPGPWPVIQLFVWGPPGHGLFPIGNLSDLGAILGRPLVLTGSVQPAPHEGAADEAVGVAGEPPSAPAAEPAVALGPDRQPKAPLTHEQAAEDPAVIAARDRLLRQLGVPTGGA